MVCPAAGLISFLVQMSAEEVLVYSKTGHAGSAADRCSICIRVWLGSGTGWSQALLLGNRTPQVCRVCQPASVQL